MKKGTARMYIGDILMDLQSCANEINKLYDSIANADENEELAAALTDKLENVFDIVDDLKNELELHKQLVEV